MRINNFLLSCGMLSALILSSQAYATDGINSQDKVDLPIGAGGTTFMWLGGGQTISTTSVNTYMTQNRINIGADHSNPVAWVDGTTGGASFGLNGGGGTIGIGTQANLLGALYIKNAPGQWSGNNIGADLVIDGSRNNGIAFLDASHAHPWAIANGINPSGLNFLSMPALGDSTTGPQTAMTLTSGPTGSLYGYVGIGTAIPTALLHVNGTANIGGALYGGDQGGSIELGCSYTSCANATVGNTPYIDMHYGTGTTQDYNVRIINDGNNQLTIATNSGGNALIINGGNVTISGSATALAYYHTSDARLKTDVHAISSPLTKLLTIHGVEFSWKKDGRPDMGVVAQNVAEVFPHIVSTNKDGIMSVEYDSLVGPMIEAIRELKAENDVTKAQLAEVKTTLKTMQAEKLQLKAIKTNAASAVIQPSPTLQH